MTLLPSAAAGGQLQHMQHCSGTRSPVSGRHAPNATLELYYSYIRAILELHSSYMRAPDGAPCAERRPTVSCSCSVSMLGNSWLPRVQAQPLPSSHSLVPMCRYSVDTTYRD